MTQRRWACSLTLVLVTVACTNSTSGTSAETFPPAAAVSTTTTVAVTTTTTEAPPEPMSAGDVLDAIDASMVYLVGDNSQGSGFVVDGGWVVTNAHVAAGFPSIMATPSGGETIEELPVVAIDWEADLAILGPLDDAPPAVTFGSSADLDRGDEVFLLGYPSETDAEPEVTISQGIVSRLRTLEEIGLRLVQTDADIAGGQSGGVLVNDRAEVVGVSGLSLDEAFALATAAEDVVDRIELLKEADPGTNRVPTDPVTSGSFSVPSTLTAATLFVAPEPEDRTMSLTLNAAIPIGFDVYLDRVYSSENSIPFAAGQLGLTVEEVLDQVPDELILRPGPDGAYQVEIPADIGGLIKVSQLGTDEPTVVEFTSSIPVSVMEDLDATTSIAVGDSIRTDVDYWEWNDVYSLDLAEGESVEITVRSMIIDPLFIVLEPGIVSLSPDTFQVDDSSIGLGGLDAQSTFTAKVAGTHRIIVADSSLSSGGYLLDVVPA
jgi:S1-C subfamily serine protease